MDADPHLAIAQQLVDAAPPGWTKLWTEGAVNDGHSKLKFAYASPEKDVNWFVPSYEQNETVHDQLQILRDRMQQDGREKWSRFTFSLEPDGRFNLNVGYDD